MDNRDSSTDSKIERAKDNALGKHDNNPSHVDEAGEAVGGIGGVLAGAAIGSAIGPIGTIIGGIAGAMGGWWGGRAVTEAASTVTRTDDDYYRNNYDTSNKLADRSFDDVRPAYHLGHVAAHNPEYANKNWNDVSSDLKRGWSADHAKKYGEWSAVSGYASEGFTRGRSALGTAANKTVNAAEKVGNKAANAVDDMKDRVDGNPASKPGPDATDSARRMDSR